MICPYCGIGINVNWKENALPIPSEDDEYDGGYGQLYGFCPECNGYIILVQHGNEYESDTYGNHGYLDNITMQEQVYPKFTYKKNLDCSVPEKYCELFREAEAVLSLSPRASATLSRYLLQRILHEELSIKKKNLEEEIKELENKTDIPSTLITMLQVMRRVANFGAHPKKSTNSNEIIDVEVGEADIMLDLINELFDYIFIKPQKQKEFLQSIKEKYNIEVENNI